MIKLDEKTPNIETNSPAQEQLIDSFDRIIDYLRISVTDRCNFRCVYCMPEAGAPVAPSAEILTNDEIQRLVAIAVNLGMTKIRITGGEPLLRKGLVELVESISSHERIKDLSLTTNGYLLGALAERLARAGLHRVNVSLDTLKHDRFKRIARRGELKEVLEGIDAAEKAGLSPLKINCVVMRGYNEDEVLDFVRLTLDRRIDVRFIELMPINWSQNDEMYPLQGAPTAAPSDGEPFGSKGSSITLYANSQLATFNQLFHDSRIKSGGGMLDASAMKSSFVATDEMRTSIEATFGELLPAIIRANGPVRSSRVAGAVGTVGFISQISNDMCINCNRLRLTADGQLRPCLMADGEVDLRSAMRTGATDSEIEEMIRITVKHKPKEHRLEDGIEPTGRNMSQLGG